MNLRVRNLVVTCRWKSGRVAASEEARRRLAVPRESVDREDSASSRTRLPRSRLARSGSALEASRLMRDNTAGLWLRGQRLRWPLQKVAHTRWGSRIPRSAGWGRLILQRTTVIHPAHVGAYVFGRTRKERYLDPTGAMRSAAAGCPAIMGGPHPHHGPRFIDCGTYLGNHDRTRHQHPASAPVRRQGRPTRCATAPIMMLEVRWDRDRLR